MTQNEIEAFANIAASLRVFYTALREVKFTRWQAFALVKLYMTNSLAGASARANLMDAQTNALLAMMVPKQ